MDLLPANIHPAKVWRELFGADQRQLPNAQSGHYLRANMALQPYQRSQEQVGVGSFFSAFAQLHGV